MRHYKPLTEPNAASDSGERDWSPCKIGPEMTNLVGVSPPSFPGVRERKKCRKDDVCERDSPDSDVVGVSVGRDWLAVDVLLSTDAMESRFIARLLCLYASYRSYASSSRNDGLGESVLGSGGSSFVGDGEGVSFDCSGTAGARRRFLTRTGRGGGRR